MYDINQGWVLEIRNSRQISEMGPTKLDSLWYFMCITCVLKKMASGPYSLCLLTLYQKRCPCIFHMLYNNFFCWKHI